MEVDVKICPFTFRFEDEEIQRMLIGNNRIIAENLCKPPGYTTLRCHTLKDCPANILNQVKQKLQQDGEAYDIFIHPIVNDVIVIVNQGPFVRSKMSKEVIVDKLCAMAVLRGADVFVQGLLAMSSDILPGDLVSVYADVDGECLKGSKPPYLFPRIHIGNGVAKYCRREVYSSKDKISGVGVQMTEPLYMSPKLNTFLPNLVFPHNLPSSLCAHILSPEAGQTVLDMCAAPGGKTSHIGTLMRNTGTLIALDKAKSKIEKLKENLSLAGVSNCHVFCADATEIHCRDKKKFGVEPPYPPRSFDRILLDAPCSALGQRPNIISKMTYKELSSYARLQQKLLSSAAELLKDDGILVYSTCTFNPQENELQMGWFLEQFSDMSLESQDVYHINHWIPEIDTTKCKLSETQLSLLQWFHPVNINVKGACYNSDTIGFFIAKLRKARVQSFG